MKVIIAMLLLTTSVVAADRWERMKECAAQAEKVKKSLEAEAGKNPGGDLRVAANHYNQKYDRCFVELYSAHIPEHDAIHKIIDGFEGVVIAEESYFRLTEAWNCYDTFGNSSHITEPNKPRPEVCGKVLQSIDRLMGRGVDRLPVLTEATKESQ